MHLMSSAVKSPVWISRAGAMISAPEINSNRFEESTMRMPLIWPLAGGLFSKGLNRGSLLTVGILVSPSRFKPNYSKLLIQNLCSKENSFGLEASLWMPQFWKFQDKEFAEKRENWREEIEERLFEKRKTARKSGGDRLRSDELGWVTQADTNREHCVPRLSAESGTIGGRRRHMRIAFSRWEMTISDVYGLVAWSNIMSGTWLPDW